MTVELGRYGAWKPLRVASPSMAVALEAMGYQALWIGGSPPGDLEAVEEIIAATTRIPVITGIVNMWREDAATVGRSYLRIAERHPDRFVLGVGVGHPESTSEYQSPLSKIGQYLDELESIGVPFDRLMLAALGPKVLQIAAQRTIGAHPYLTTHRHTRLAREVMGQGPLLAPEQKVILDTDAGRARAEGAKTVSRYLRLVNYRNNLVREGWADRDLAGHGSDALLDELVIHGDAQSVVDGVNTHLASGADHVCIQALGPDPLSEYQEMAGILFD